MKLNFWQTELPGPEGRAWLAVAGVVGGFVALFVGSIALSYFLNRAPSGATEERESRPLSQSIDRPQAPPAQDAAVSLPPARTTDEWKVQLVTLLQHHKRFPDGMRCERGTVQLAFRLDREGGIVSRRIESSAGNAAFDAEALALLARIGRFPPPPAPAPEFQDFTVPIRFEGQGEGCARN
jgi:TonB family protein